MQVKRHVQRSQAFPERQELRLVVKGGRVGLPMFV
jgi:hypothetical protein